MAKSPAAERAKARIDDTSRIKAKDVALVANVSLSAVSRTFTPGASVSPATRAKVMAVAEQLGYRPNILARGLTTRRTHLVGVVAPLDYSPFFESFVSKLNHALACEGQRMLLLLIGSQDEADQALQQALDYSVDGLIFVTSAPSPGTAEAAARSNVPIVVLNKGEGLPRASYVWLDGAALGRKVADIFIAEGRQAALAIAGVRGKPHARDLLAFMDAMHQATGRPTTLIEADGHYATGVDLALEILRGPKAPDCIYAMTDFLALGVYDAARFRLGVDVPGALSIVGNGDTEPTHWLSHAISTVRPPLDTLVKTAVSTLVAHIETPGLPAIHSYVDCDIVRRATTLPGAEAAEAAPARARRAAARRPVAAR